VLDILEHAARYYRGIDCDDSTGCTVLTDPEIPTYNVDTMAGLSYRIDPTRPEGERVVDVRFGGRPIDPVREFTLVCNNYRAAGGGGFPHLAEAERVWQSSEEMSDLIGDAIARTGVWQPGVDGNWWLGPPLVGERPSFAPE
jgi:2',3'-cyclic-nucleotide 2'-phosphodiesterase/3'-nucleotidase